MDNETTEQQITTTTEEQAAPPAAAAEIAATATPQNQPYPEWQPEDRPIRNVVGETARKVRAELEPYLAHINPENLSKLFSDLLDKRISEAEQKRKYAQDGQVLRDQDGNVIAVQPHQAGLDRIDSLEKTLRQFISTQEQRELKATYQAAKTEQEAKNFATYKRELATAKIEDSAISRAAVERFMLEDGLDVVTAVKRFAHELGRYQRAQQQNADATRAAGGAPGPLATPRSGGGSPNTASTDFSKAKTVEEARAMFMRAIRG